MTVRSNGYVIATAGHVDHGKSTLVRALTGIEPDRWEAERRRGLTIDLGFAWATLPSGENVAFVDVPGHERFLGNMLAGLGPAPIVCFVVAADEGWSAQSSDHRDALAALRIEHGLIVVTKTDRAPGRVPAVIEAARHELAGTGLAEAPAVAVSARSGAGLDDLKSALADVLAAVPTPSTTDRVRLWVDRSFTITGAGTVVTGTLSSGTLTVGERIAVHGRNSLRTYIVRGLQSQGRDRESVGPTNRVAVNLRGATATDIARGDTVATPDAWRVTSVVDARRVSGTFREAPRYATAHVGTAAIPVTLRPFDDNHVRLTFARPVPLVREDRIVVRDPGSRRIIGGLQVLDADPPTLHRRGDGVRRALTLDGLTGASELYAEVARRGAVRRDRLHQLGLVGTGDGVAVPDGVREVGGWWIEEQTFGAWAAGLAAAIDALHEHDPLAAGLSRGAARDRLNVPDDDVLDALVADLSLDTIDGHLARPGHRGDLWPIEPAIVELEQRWRGEPFAAPESDDLLGLKLGDRELAAAARAGRILRLRDDIVLPPTSPALAMRTLVSLSQPFTTSEARQALGVTRRIAIPLLEHLDGRGWTRRLDAGHREVRR